MRISITHDCNFSCFFCHMEGEDPSLKDYLSPEEIGIVAEAASILGARRFKITGGEPTLRRDLPDIIRELRLRGGAEDVSMTTNGVLLKRLAKDLRRAGLDRVNVSLHSTDPVRFKQITGRDMIEAVFDGIEAAIEAGFKQIKINMVILRGFNEQDVWSMVEFVRRKGLILQLIELHPVGEGRRVFSKYHAFLEDLEERLSKISRMRVRRELHNRPVYELEGGGAVEIVRPVKNPLFCAACTRIRLTADGKLKPCLVRDDNLVPLKGVLRSSLAREEKVKMVVEAILAANSLREPSAYWRIGEDFEKIVNRYLGQGLSLDGGLRIALPKRAPTPNVRIHVEALNAAVPRRRVLRPVEDL